MIPPDTPSARGTLAIRGRTFAWGTRTYVMGIVNVTPDSFSGDGLCQGDGGAECAEQRAVEQGMRFVGEGADILDIGGESSRPGSQPVDAETELARVLPVIRGLRRHSDITISVDTTKAAVASAALQAGADMINDISALQADASMSSLAAERGVPVILMHRRQAPQRVRHGERGPHFVAQAPAAAAPLANLLAQVVAELRAAVDNAQQAGIQPANLIVDPGIGFGKAREENLYLVNHLDALVALGLPILLGASRKAFIGYTLNAATDDRVEGTAAAVCVGIVRGADIIRVHDVAQMVRVARMTDALVRENPL